MSEMNIDQVRIPGNPEELKTTSSNIASPVDTISPTASSANVMTAKESITPVQSNQGSPSPNNITVKDNSAIANSRVSKKTSKKKKNLCYYDKCTSAASKFIGDCNFCKGHYCSKHRLMENHACEGLTTCKEAMHKRNAEKLAAEQTRAPKIQI